LNSGNVIRRLVQQYRVFLCIDCGKCTGACPLAQVDSAFSPRLFARRVIEEGIDNDYVRSKVWNCLTCGLCRERCPEGIDFAQFVRALRRLYFESGQSGHLSHGGALQGLMRMQAARRLAQRRCEWISPDLKVAQGGELLYFVGCLPYFDLFFNELGVNMLPIAADTVRIFNALGITPVVLPDERCCGHDLYWSGDERNFRRLRDLNLAGFRQAGVKTIVTSCAECSYTLKHLYADPSAPLPFEVMHLSEFLHAAGVKAVRRSPLTATFQDPCRLARFQGICDQPRELLGSAVALREMRHWGTAGWCCGNSSWLHCDRYSKQMQVERLCEARDTGADLLVTACPKCQIHLRCAMRDVNRRGNLTMEIRDFASIMAPAVCGTEP